MERKTLKMNQENKEKRKQALELQQNCKETSKPTVNGGVTGKLKRKRTETSDNSVGGRTVKATNGKNASDSEDEFY